MIRIALTDDMPIVLEGVKLLLERVKDFEVVAEYNNGKELVDNIRSVNADIVLTDIDMPVMDGKTATRILLSQDPGKKIIALSMYSDYDNYFEMITSGAKGFVLKQSTAGELEKAIRDVFNGGNFFSSDLLHNIILNLNGKPKISEAEKVNLTDREVSILTNLCNGLSNKELAEKMFLSVKTIESSKTKLMSKLGAKNTSGLVIWAIKNKVVDF
ncbi:MAG TPA: response regulator transcription factor [Bacteroidales bacterium]|nr:response regulator transcription factor [Bacteroidales bacterium]